MTSDSTLPTPATLVLPGKTIGMVGGGQLGRMFAIAAMQMGFRVVVFCGDPDEPAAQVADQVETGDLDDESAVERFASQCDVITLEFENIPARTMQWCERYAATYPSHQILATTQDRLIEKQTFADAGLAVTPFARVDSADSVVAFASRYGWPVIVKTARSGYDGKGQHRIEDERAAENVPWNSADAWIAEKWIPFQRECSVIVARSTTGQVCVFPAFENEHRNHILDVSVCPASLSEFQNALAREIASRAAEVLALVGVLCVELFVVDDHTMLINEVAPRPHNSGHLTIEACHCSQFEQHVRAVCGLPLGSTDLRVGGASMANLLGDLWQQNDGKPAWDQAIAEPGVSLHLYGKSQPRCGRKMGHLTATAESRDLAKASVLTAREALSSRK